MNETPIASRESVPTGQMESTESSLQELRVRVAELCGWTHMDDVIDIYPDRRHWFAPGKANSLDSRDLLWLPDYCNDLNACAELIDVMAERGWTCIMNQPEGRGRNWRCAFNRYEDGIGYSYAKHASRLAASVSKAFVAVMESRPDTPSVPSPTEALTASGVPASPDSPSSPSPLVSVEEWTREGVMLMFANAQDFPARRLVYDHISELHNASLASLTEEISSLRASLAVAEARLDWLHIHARWTDKERRLSITFPMETVKFVTLNETIDAAIKSASGITDAP